MCSFFVLNNVIILCRFKRWDIKMNNQIRDIVTAYPKHYTRKIKNDNTLNDIVISYPGDSYAEKVFNAINDNTTIDTCPIGNNYKFKDVFSGYKFCGRTGVCQCAKESVSSNVSATKSKYDDATIERINQKRASTNLREYGVENIGQSAHAKEAHSIFYNDATKVHGAMEKIKDTKRGRYGNENYNNSSKIKETWRSKSISYWAEKYPEKDIEALYDKEEMIRLFGTMNPVEIAAYLNVHVQTVYRYLNKHGITEPFRSIPEQELVDFLKSNGVSNIVTNSRSILPDGKELDIYLPDYNIAIEYNGVYWHHEDVAHITRSYHKDKFDMAESMGIQLITIFSNFWNNNQDVVKKSLLHKLGLVDGSVYARNTCVKQVDSRACRDFLNSNHIQGYTPAAVCYALFHDDDIVAVMTFAKSRVAIGKQSDGMELVRFASNQRIVGGASKLLSAFRKDNPSISVFSYSNNEWSTGHVYSALGFKLAREIPPSYWYIHPKEERLMHRFNYAKQKLVARGADPALTEKQICKEMGLLKIWDCGKRKWVLNPT